MIKKLALVGAVLLVGGAQAVTLQFCYRNETMRCILNEENEGRVELNETTAIVVTAVPQEDGSVIADVIVETAGQTHATTTIQVTTEEPIVLTCEAEGSTESIVVTLEPTEEIAQVV